MSMVQSRQLEAGQITIYLGKLRECSLFMTSGVEKLQLQGSYPFLD